MAVSAASRLPLSWCKDDLSVAYVAGLAAGAGVTMEPPKRDINSVDAVFSARDDEHECSPELRVQLKCTEKPFTTSRSHPGMWRFSLKAKNYNDLRRTPTHPPRLLVVVFCPSNQSDWTITAFPQAMLLQAQAWWVSLEGAPELKKGQKTVTVSIPQNQRFDTTALLANMRSFS